jgi:hypothetical protein
MNLNTQAPRSPRTRLGGYVILARTTDKCHAFLEGTLGDYHFDCPLDNMLFGFKGVKGDDFKAQVVAGAGDDALAEWLNANGTPKTAEEIKAWSDGMAGTMPYENPERRDWFAEQCGPLGLDPAKTTLFDWLDADDKASFGK